MNEATALRAIASRQRARAAWAHPHDLSETRAEGRVIGYSPTPMVLIETESGEQVWWGAELVDIVPEGEQCHRGERCQWILCPVHAP